MNIHTKAASGLDRRSLAGDD